MKKYNFDHVTISVCYILTNHDDGYRRCLLNRLQELADRSARCSQQYSSSAASVFPFPFLSSLLSLTVRRSKSFPSTHAVQYDDLEEENGTHDIIRAIYGGSRNTPCSRSWVWPSVQAKVVAMEVEVEMEVDWACDTAVNSECHSIFRSVNEHSDDIIPSCFYGLRVLQGFIIISESNCMPTLHRICSSPFALNKCL